MAVFFETSVFTRRVTELLPDDEYADLQRALVDNPDAGDLIPGSGGLRKIRWAGQGRGKRGGLRVIYYYLVNRDQFYMLLIYGKNEQDDLSPEQLRTLRRAVEAIG
jgi:mRNA-degrading endonuclease RelE of RelBE toxin-antitoxin system